MAVPNLSPKIDYYSTENMQNLLLTLPSQENPLFFIDILEKLKMSKQKEEEEEEEHFECNAQHTP